MPLSFSSGVSFLTITISDHNSEIDDDNDDDTPLPHPEDISEYPDLLATDPDDHPDQSIIMEEIIRNSLTGPSPLEVFDNMDQRPLKLSHLSRLYENSNSSVLNILSRRNTLCIDEEYCLPSGQGRINMDASDTRLDYCNALTGVKARRWRIGDFESEVLDWRAF